MGFESAGLKAGMNHQASFAESEYARKKKTTRREKFLAQMEAVVPWARLVEVIVPHYPSGKRGRPPVGIERMLRLYFLAQWYALADEALEDALYDSQAMRNFTGIDLAHDRVPDETTVLNFRHLLDRYDLCKAIFEEINLMLRERGIQMREGTMVDATIIAAPPSTKNQSGKRSAEMHQTKKGNQWYFGMKAHIGSDTKSRTVHSLATTAANEADIHSAAQVLHGDEKHAHFDAGYTGADKREDIREKAPEAELHIAAKRGKIKAMPEGDYKRFAQGLERCKAQVRAGVEHAFHIVKNIFGYRKTRYQGLKKNTTHLHILFALANLVIARRPLLPKA